jgi:hypothetical protein
MPNWVFNYLTIDGDEQILETVRQMLNQPFTTKARGQWNYETCTYEEGIFDIVHSNPVFAFWNIYKPSDEILDEYFGDNNWDNKSPNHWYTWNIAHWGTKWDVAVSDNDKYSNTSLDQYKIGDKTITGYRFHTAWSPPQQAIEILAFMFPQLTFTLSYEEEQGWAGLLVWENGVLVTDAFYDIPESHQDWVDRDEEDRCECQVGNDTEYWFEDCPMEDEGFIFDTEAKEWKQKVSNE